MKELCRNWDEWKRLQIKLMVLISFYCHACGRQGYKTNLRESHRIHPHNFVHFFFLIKVFFLSSLYVPSSKVECMYFAFNKLGRKIHSCIEGYSFTKCMCIKVVWVFDINPKAVTNGRWNSIDFTWRWAFCGAWQRFSFFFVQSLWFRLLEKSRAPSFLKSSTWRRAIWRPKGERRGIQTWIYCEFCSNRILLYFPMLVSYSVCHRCFLDNLIVKTM